MFIHRSSQKTLRFQKRVPSLSLLSRPPPQPNGVTESVVWEAVGREWGCTFSSQNQEPPFGHVRGLVNSNWLEPPKSSVGCALQMYRTKIHWAEGYSLDASVRYVIHSGHSIVLFWIRFWRSWSEEEAPKVKLIRQWIKIIWMIVLTLKWTAMVADYAPFLFAKCLYIHTKMPCEENGTLCS